MTTMAKFSEKFKIKELKIYETDYWIWSLRPHQTTLGAGILSLKRECSNFSELNQEEYSDLNNIIKVIEKTLKKTFNYDIMNYLMLMMVDKQVHYHVIPRYEKEFEIFGRVWKDRSWPGIPKLNEENLEGNLLVTVCNYIKNNLVVKLN
ncbi:MAG: HIT family protein [Tissierellaceae bacterium]|jgi:diadenosine tetraphosphate (Ap4A) HIT family hydrolase